MTKLERPRFDLTREPWITCETLDGKTVALGFEGVLLQAHELAAIHDESPLATAVIHRLLLAILHRVVDGPRSLDEWERLWIQPHFPANRIRSYLDRWRHRFDLFDAERPFLQVPRLAEALMAEQAGKVAETIPGRRLALERSGYAGAVNLLEHGGDDAGLTPAGAIRALLGFLGFGPGGRILNDSGYPKACPLRAGAVVLARGKTLQQTLLLNLLVIDRDWPVPSADDEPAWEAEACVRRVKRAVRGWLDALTWQSRRVELVPSGTVPPILVNTAVTGVGVECGGEWLEPMHALFVRDPKRGPEAVRLDPDRSPWRDCTALFQATDSSEGHRRPAVCSQIASLVERGVLERASRFALDLYGLASSQAAIRLWRVEHMPLPLRLLTDAERLDAVRNALGTAEDAEKALRGSVWLLARFALALGDRSPDKEDIGALANRFGARQRYWAALGARFDEFLRDIGTSESPEVVLAAWRVTARDSARRALADATQQLGTNARALQACANAERHLARSLADLSPQTVLTPSREGASA